MINCISIHVPAIRKAGATLGLALLLALPAQAQPVIVSESHTDLEFNYAEGAWEAAVHNEPIGEIEPADALLYLANEPYPDGGRLSRPPGSQWDFLGMPAGGDVWVYPDTAEPGLLAPGFSTEETPASALQAWVPDSSHSLGLERWIQIQLLSLSGPGHFSLWTTDSFGVPTVWMETLDGISSGDSYYLPAGGHVHVNWGFSEPGLYEIMLRANTVLAGGAPSAGEAVAFHFGIGTVPEPGASAALAGMAAAGLLGVRRWRRAARAGRG